MWQRKLHFWIYDDVVWSKSKLNLAFSLYKYTIVKYIEVMRNRDVSYRYKYFSCC